MGAASSGCPSCSVRARIGSDRSGDPTAYGRTAILGPDPVLGTCRRGPPSGRRRLVRDGIPAMAQREEGWHQGPPNQRLPCHQGPDAHPPRRLEAARQKPVRGVRPRPCPAPKRTGDRPMPGGKAETLPARIPRHAPTRLREHRRHHLSVRGPSHGFRRLLRGHVPHPRLDGRDDTSHQRRRI